MTRAGRAALVGAAVFVLGILALAGTTVWSAVEYNRFEDLGLAGSPTLAVSATAAVGVAVVAAGLLGALAAVTVLIIRSRRG